MTSEYFAYPAATRDCSVGRAEDCSVYIWSSLGHRFKSGSRDCVLIKLDVILVTLCDILSQFNG